LICWEKLCKNVGRGHFDTFRLKIIETLSGLKWSL